jgi:hypothetical protein
MVDERSTSDRALGDGPTPGGEHPDGRPSQGARRIASSGSPNDIRAEVVGGAIGWAGPLVVLGARTLLLLLAQASVAGIYILRESSSPWGAAAAWWSVSWTVADLGCLILLYRFTRREGRRIIDLFGRLRLRWGHDVFLGLGLWLAIFPVFMAGALLTSGLVYGSLQPPVYPGQVGERVLPLWAVIYSFASVALWSATEEASYQGYVLPRLEALTGRPWRAVLLVGLCWALQHSVLPLILDWRWVVFRFLAFLPGVLLLIAAYRRIRRLTPLVVAHWPMDVAALLMTLRL